MDKFFDEVYDSFLNKQTQYGGKTREYVLGRHMFSVPDVLKESSRSSVYIDLFPPVPPWKQWDQSPYHTESLHLTEILWSTTDHQKEFEALWRPVREEGINSSDVRKYGDKEYTENLDAGKLFGFPAVCIAHNQQSSPTIETFIALPQGILQIKEIRSNHEHVDGIDIAAGTDIEVPALQLFSCYSWGKSRNDAPGAFYTRFGKIYGYVAKDETIVLNCDKSGRYPDLLFRSEIPPFVLSPVEKMHMDEVRNNTHEYPILSVNNLVSRAHMIDGVEFMEYINRVKQPDNDEEKLFFYFQRQNVGTAERPDVLLAFEGKWGDRAEMALIWSHIITSFNYAQPVSDERARR